jgi:capsular polysaccharide transport system permease protein
MLLFAYTRRYLQLLKALLFRESDLRRLHPIEAIVNLLEPVVLILALTLIVSFIGRRSQAPLGGPPILYYSTGFFPLYLFLYISRRLRTPVLGRGRFAVEQRLDHILVHIVLRILEYTILGFLLFTILYVFFTKDAIPKEITPIFGASAAIVALGFGWIVINQSVSKMFRRGSRLWPLAVGLISRSMFLFSGVVYVPDFIEPGVRYFLSFNPLLHAVQLFRMAFYPLHPTLIFDGAYLAKSAFVAILLGVMVERVTKRYEV